MILAFTERKAWAVGLVFLVTGPFFGMLFLYEARWAFAYLAGVIAADAGVSYLLDEEVYPWSVFLAPVLFYVVGLAHGVVMARRKETARGTDES